jgi:hypothetical protein
MKLFIYFFVYLFVLGDLECETGNYFPKFYKSFFNFLSRTYLPFKGVYHILYIKLFTRSLVPCILGRHL